MNILNVEDKGNGYMIITTNNEDRPVFVYRKDKFETPEAMEAEILRSIAKEQDIKEKKEKKFKKIKEHYKNA